MTPHDDTPDPPLPPRPPVGPPQPFPQPSQQPFAPGASWARAGNPPLLPGPGQQLHPRHQEMLDQQAARQVYDAKLAAGVPHAQAWRDYKKQWRKAYRRRLLNELKYVDPHPRPQKPPGEVEKFCNTCDRVESKVECWTCGCFGTSWLVWMMSARTVDLPRRRGRATLPAKVGLAAIRGYQRGISAHTPARCRFTPTCSQYGAQAFRRYGLAAGSRLTALRIHRCTSTVPRGTPDPLP